MKRFKTWVIEQYKDEDSPAGDFARDLKCDKNFPMWAEGGFKIKWYLKYNCNACEECLDVFEELWKKYVKVRETATKGKNKKTAMPFREFVWERYGHLAKENSEIPLHLMAYEILTDETFPDNETDGLMVMAYIKDRQCGLNEDDNLEMLDAFETMWMVYKKYFNGKLELRPLE